MKLRVNDISFYDIVNIKISKREFTFLKGSVRINRKQKIIIDMSNKGINEHGEKRKKQSGDDEQPKRLRHATSQDETMKICRVNLPIADYGQLVQLALRKGCTPEELVAQQIERFIRKDIK